MASEIKNCGIVRTWLVPGSTSGRLVLSVDLWAGDHVFADCRAIKSSGAKALITWPWGKGKNVQVREPQRRQGENKASKQSEFEEVLTKLIEKEFELLEGREFGEAA